MGKDDARAGVRGSSARGHILPHSSHGDIDVRSGQGHSRGICREEPGIKKRRSTRLEQSKHGITRDHTGSDTYLTRVTQGTRVPVPN